MKIKDDLEQWESIPELSNFMGGVKDSTKTKYKDAIFKYELFTGLSSEELIDEAEAERKKARREQGDVKRRLQGFHKWLSEDWVQRDRYGNVKKDKKGNKIVGLGAFKVNMVVGNIKSFYSANGFVVKWKPPRAAPKKENQRVELSPKMVRQLLSVLKSNRDRSIVLTGFQGGFDSDTVSKLNIGDLPRGFVSALEKSLGDIEEALGKIKTPVVLHIVRDKEGVDYHTCLGHDAVEALLVYLWERVQAGEYLSPEMPLYTLTDYNGAKLNPERRIKPVHIHRFMREGVIRAGVIDKKTLDYADFNPAGFHALRSSFSKRLEFAGMPSAYIDYMQGHSLPYNGAYRRPNAKKLLEKYKEFEEAMSVTKAPKTVSELEENLRRELDKERAYAQSLEERISRIEKTFGDSDKMMDFVTSVIG